MTSQSLTISKNESSMLSLLRVLAMGSIVVCHILQTLDNNWAWVFNVGVQVFLVLSGYLYGHKVIDKWIPWFISRLKKLYIPYIIFVLFFLVLYLITGLQEVNIKSAIVYVFGLQGIIGGGIKVFGHLWFMTAIAMCYMITPILQKVSSRSTLCTVGLLVLCVIEYYVLPIRLNIFSWLFLYSVGYFLPRMSQKMKVLMMSSVTIMLLFAVTGISWADIRNGAINSTIMHNCIGILSVCLFSIIGKKVRFGVGCKLLSFLDALSYFVFIVHVPFVRPPHEILHVTAIAPVNILLVMVLIFISAVLLEQVTKKLTSKITSFVQ